ncbi:MAG: hypothetical protein U5K31_02865 [Balneolaceae bacterium]|nr:hypothetical protein [Balneolaceae bacterium]
MKEDAFMNRGVIYREQDNFDTEAISFDLQAVMQNPSANDIELQERDVIYINNIFEMREDAHRPYQWTRNGAAIPCAS